MRRGACRGLRITPQRLTEKHFHFAVAVKQKFWRELWEPATRVIGLTTVQAKANWFAICRLVK